MKKILKFIIILLPWFIGGLLFKFDTNYYSTLNIPSFALPGKLISITWFIIYILISISIYKLSKEKNIFKERDYFYILITNYLANQLFTFAFTYLKSPFFGFVITTITFISSIFLYLETKKLSKSSSYYLIPYMIYGLYAFILSLVTYVINF